MVIRDTATGIPEQAISEGRSAALGRVPRHSTRSPRCDALSDRCVLLRSSRCALESRLPRHLWHCFCFYAMPRARGNGIAPEPKFGLPAKIASKEVSIMKSLTFIQWYRILRAHHQWTVFQSIHYALWLMR